jgi:hypothetical protein
LPQEIVFDTRKCKPTEYEIKKQSFWRHTEVLTVSNEEFIETIRKRRLYTFKAHSPRSIFIFYIRDYKSVPFFDLHKLFKKRHLHPFLAYKAGAGYYILFSFVKSYSGVYADRIYEAISLLINQEYPDMCSLTTFEEEIIYRPIFYAKDIIFQDMKAVAYLFQVHEIYQNILKYNLSIEPYSPLHTVEENIRNVFYDTFKERLQSPLYNISKPSIYQLTDNSKLTDINNIHGYSFNYLSISNIYKADIATHQQNTVQNNSPKNSITISILTMLYQLNLLNIFNISVDALFLDLVGAKDTYGFVYKHDDKYYYTTLDYDAKVYTIISLVQELFQQITYQFKVHPIDVYFWLINEIGIETDTIRTQLQNGHKYLDIIKHSDKLKHKNSIVYKRLTNKTTVYRDILSYLIETAINDKYYNANLKFSYLACVVSIKNLSCIVKKSDKRVREALKLLIHLGLIEKVPDSEFSEYITEHLDIKSKEEYGRRVSVFRIPYCSDELFKRVEYCIQHKELLYSPQDLAVRFFDNDKEAQEPFFGQERDMRITSDGTELVQKRILSFIIERVQEHGYVSFTAVTKYTIGLLNNNEWNARRFLRSFLANRLPKKDLVCRCYSMDIQKRFKITEKLHFGSSRIIFKKELKNHG